MSALPVVAPQKTAHSQRRLSVVPTPRSAASSLSPQSAQSASSPELADVYPLRRERGVVRRPVGVVHTRRKARLAFPSGNQVHNVALHASSLHSVLYLAIRLAVLAVISLSVLLALVGIALVLGVGEVSTAVTVQSGDTLWSIAESLPDAPSTSQALADIRSLNNLGSDILYTGQILRVPAY